MYIILFVVWKIISKFVSGFTTNNLKTTDYTIHNFVTWVRQKITKHRID